MSESSIEDTLKKAHVCAETHPMASIALSLNALCRSLVETIGQERGQSAAELAAEPEIKPPAATHADAESLDRER
ncbi:MAG: hypothetical protein ACOYUK_03935 [Patescibacteria group bacterium]